MPCLCFTVRAIDVLIQLNDVYHSIFYLKLNDDKINRSWSGIHLFIEMCISENFLEIHSSTEI